MLLSLTNFHYFEFFNPSNIRSMLHQLHCHHKNIHATFTQHSTLGFLRLHSKINPHDCHTKSFQTFLPSISKKHHRVSTQKFHFHIRICFDWVLHVKGRMRMRKKSQKPQHISKAHTATIISFEFILVAFTHKIIFYIFLGQT